MTTMQAMVVTTVCVHVCICVICGVWVCVMCVVCGYSLITQEGGFGDHIPSEAHLMVSGPPERE